MDDNEVQAPLGPTGNEKDGEQDSDSDAAEADPGSRSDSLEGIPEMVEAESNTSLMGNEEDNEEDKEAPLGAAGKETDGEKDYDEAPPAGATEEEKDGEKMNKEGPVNSQESDSETCPMEANSNPGHGSDRTPEPQGTFDEERSNQVFDVDKLNSLSTNEDLHCLCKKFPRFSLGVKNYTANIIASRHLGLMIEHFLHSPETVCTELMYAVLASSHCNLDISLACFMKQVNGGWLMQESEEKLLAKVKAIRGIEAIVRHLSDTESLNAWLPYHFTTLANVLVSHFQPKKEGTTRKFKTYLVPGEVIDIFAILLQRLNLVYQINSKFCPR
ncbi:uncharacterized protein LOC121931947 [Sceloporus undulatus]|uniref:uncharacterized protein LOC121931947 n=1 Tax=Sceloporus undulatus TaxID=8520 RepID=UPI001C4B8B12|nr:uncharacterized protein LOC121931947 [Sceloporus undulatus]